MIRNPSLLACCLIITVKTIFFCASGQGIGRIGSASAIRMQCHLAICTLSYFADPKAGKSSPNGNW